MFKGWKTIVILNLMFAAYALQWENITQLIKPEYVAEGSLLVGILLRYFTTTSIFKSK